MKFSIYRYNPEQDSKPRMQAFELDDSRITPGMMLLDALLLLKAQDESLGFRRSCGEGVCGSDGMNINGRNGLACITPLADLGTPVRLRPLPGMPVIRDLIVDLEQFYAQYRAVKPWLPKSSTASPPPRVSSSTACTSASCVPAARRPARPSGGTRTGFSARRPCCSHGAFWPTAATRPRTSVWRIWRDRSACSAATPS